MDTIKEISIYVISFLLAVLLMSCWFIVLGWILSLLWNWLLINELALSIPQLTIWTGTGIVLLITFIKDLLIPNKSSN